MGDDKNLSQPTDVFDVVVQQTRDLADVRYERHIYRAWFGAALDKLHEQEREIESTRRQNAALRDEVRRLAAQLDAMAEAA